MKKGFSLALMAVVATLVAGGAKAQVTDSILPVKDGNFEQWVDYPGDTVVFGIPIPVIDPYSLPEGWHAPMFTINDTVDLGGARLPMNVSLPVAKVSRDTVHAPQGRSALVAETFKLEDVLTPVASMIVGQVLDSSLAQEVIPSIVTNAEVDLMKILPLMERMSVSTSNLDWLLNMMDTVDLNDLIKGGAPLNGFELKKVRGLYKYQDANGDGDIDDNATLVVLGTYYDPFLQRRVLVGAGSKNLFQLYDTVYYEPFELDYYTLNEYYPADYEFVQADSVVVIAISSTNEKNRARGSKLFLDSLVLVQRDGSCGRVEEVRLESYSQVYAVLSWSCSVVPDHYTIEVGEQGFVRGRGSRFTVTDSTLRLVDLQPSTTYDFYIRSECSDTAMSVWKFFQFTTDSVTHHSVSEVEAERVTLHPNPANGRCTVDFGGMDVSRLTLYTAVGQVVERRAVDGRSATLALPAKGVYIVELQTEQGVVYKKVVNS